MAIRKINVSSKAAAKSKAKAAPAPVIAAPPAKPARSKPDPSATVAAKPRRVAVPRVEHALAVQYSGPSLGVNKRKSVTAIDIRVFGTKPDYVLTDRTKAVASAIKRTVGKAAFPRGNIDAGVLKYLGMKGYVEHVEGDPATEQATFKFTPEGLKHIPA